MRFSRFFRYATTMQKPRCFPVVTWQSGAENTWSWCNDAEQISVSARWRLVPEATVLGNEKRFETMYQCLARNIEVYPFRAYVKNLRSFPTGHFEKNSPWREVYDTGYIRVISRGIAIFTTQTSKELEFFEITSVWMIFFVGSSSNK